MAAASAIGASHRSREAPCQDAFAVHVDPSGALILAVADGAGSARRSREGARRAADTVVEALRVPAAWMADGARRADGLEAMSDAFAVARAAIDAAREPTAGLRDYGCTLTCAVVLPDRLVVGQVGDGLAVAQRPSGRLVPATRPQRGEYANEVPLLTSDAWRAALEVRTWSGALRGLALTTDGLLRLAVRLPSLEPHGPFFEPLLRFVRETPEPEHANETLASFLSSDRVSARTDDDTTLVVATRVDPVTASTR